jgi:hypothetical protein
MEALIVSFAIYLLAIGVGDCGPAADLLVLVGGALLPAGLFLCGFTIKRFLCMTSLGRHVRGKNGLALNGRPFDNPYQRHFLRLNGQSASDRGPRDERTPSHN